MIGVLFGGLRPHDFKSNRAKEGPISGRVDDGEQVPIPPAERDPFPTCTHSASAAPLGRYQTAMVWAGFVCHLKSTALKCTSLRPAKSKYGTPASETSNPAEALAYAHGQGVLHRDIKPSNLILDSSGQIWVTDFGLAKVEGTEALTDTGEVVGTLKYLAPESVRGQVDPRSDVYCLGLTLYPPGSLKSATSKDLRMALRGKAVPLSTQFSDEMAWRLDPG